MRLPNQTRYDLDLTRSAAAVRVANESTDDGLSIRIEPAAPIASATFRDSRLRFWPPARRAMTEKRDRALALDPGLRSRSHE